MKLEKVKSEVKSQESKIPSLEKKWTEIPDEGQLFLCANQIDWLKKTFEQQDLDTLNNGRGCCAGLLLVISKCHIHPELSTNQQILRGYEKCLDHVKNKKPIITQDQDIIAFINAVAKSHREHLSLVGPLVGLGKFKANVYQTMCDEIKNGDRFVFGTEYYYQQKVTHAISVTRLSEHEYLLIDTANSGLEKVTYRQSENDNIGQWIEESLKKRNSQITCIHYKSKDGGPEEKQVPAIAKKIMENATLAPIAEWGQLKPALVRICNKLNVPLEVRNIFLTEGLAPSVHFHHLTNLIVSIQHFEFMKQLLEPAQFSKLLEEKETDGKLIGLIKTSDTFKRIISILEAPQKIVFFNKFQHELPKLIETAADFKNIVKYLPQELQRTVFEDKVIHSKLPDIIKTGKEFKEVLEFLPPELRIALYENPDIQSKFPTLIKTVDELKVLSFIPAEKHSHFFRAIEKSLQKMILTPLHFSQLFNDFNFQQREVIFESKILQDILSEMIKTSKNFESLINPLPLKKISAILEWKHIRNNLLEVVQTENDLVTVLNCFRQYPDILQQVIKILQDKIPDIIKNPEVFGKILQNFNPKECKIVFMEVLRCFFIKEKDSRDEVKGSSKLPKMIDGADNFGRILLPLNPDQQIEICKGLALNKKLKNIIQNEKDLNVVISYILNNKLGENKQPSAEQRNVIIIILKEISIILPEMIQTPKDLLNFRSWFTVNDFDNFCESKAVRAQLVKLIRTGDDFVEIFQTLPFNKRLDFLEDKEVRIKLASITHTVDNIEKVKHYLPKQGHFATYIDAIQKNLPKINGIANEYQCNLIAMGKFRLSLNAYVKGLEDDIKQHDDNYHKRSVRLFGYEFTGNGMPIGKKLQAAQIFVRVMDNDEHPAELTKYKEVLSQGHLGGFYQQYILLKDQNDRLAIPSSSPEYSSFTV